MYRKVTSKVIDSGIIAPTITPNSSSVYPRSRVVINANVVRATHGETRGEVLGRGNGRPSRHGCFVKSHTLRHTVSTGAGTKDSRTKTHIGDMLWYEAESITDPDSSGSHFIVTTDEDGKSTVIFVDGTEGVRLPSGIDSITATYRCGLGNEGEILIYLDTWGRHGTRKSDASTRETASGGDPKVNLRTDSTGGVRGRVCTNRPKPQCDDIKYLFRITQMMVPLRTGKDEPNPTDAAFPLLDAWASVADILTFSQERISNDTYLRTETEQRKNLGRRKSRLINCKTGGACKLRRP